MPFAVIKLAIDRSARRVDVDGRLHIDKSHISKAAVNPYYGAEIPGWQQLGLDENKVYRLLRDPVELERGAHTFERLPILSRHVDQPIGTDGQDKDLIIGAIGSDVAFNSPYLDADLVFWDGEAIAGIDEDKVKELSCGYRYVPVMEAGEFEGQAYDGRMTDIVGNHLALVEVGRAGSDVVVADSNPFQKVKSMKMTKLGKALFVALSAMSPTLAADSALPALVGKASKKTVKVEDVKKAVLAIDAEVDPQMLDNLLDAVIGVEDEPKAIEPMASADESPADKIKSLLAGKVEDDVLNAVLGCLQMPAADEKAVDLMKDSDMVSKEDMKADVKAATDALRGQLLAAQKAAVEVRPVIGDVLGCDSAEEIYGLALKHMDVDCEGVSGVAALRALYQVASKAHLAGLEAPVHLAADSADKMVEKFPGAARFSRA